MFKTKTVLSALALAAVTGAAWAQTTETPAPAAEGTAQPAQEAPATETTTGTTAGTAVDPNLDTGTSTEPQVGQGYVKEEVGDWQLQCVKQEDPATEPCQLYQLLRGAEGNPVAEVIVEKLPEGNQIVAGATIAVPHGTALAKDLRIAVDGGQGKLYRYAFCDQVSCYARIGLLGPDIAAFKKGSKATVVLFSYEAPEKPVELALSLSGFTAGFEKTRSAPAPAAPKE